MLSKVKGVCFQKKSNALPRNLPILRITESTAQPTVRQHSILSLEVEGLSFNITLAVLLCACATSPGFWTISKLTRKLERQDRAAIAAQGQHVRTSSWLCSYQRLVVCRTAAAGTYVESGCYMLKAAWVRLSGNCGHFCLYGKN